MSKNALDYTRSAVLCHGTRTVPACTPRVARPAMVSKLRISAPGPGGIGSTEGGTMSENRSDTPNSDPEEKGAEKAGQLEDHTEGGYGGPDIEDEVAPGFEADNDGASGS